MHVTHTLYSFGNLFPYNSFYLNYKNYTYHLFMFMLTRSLVYILNYIASVIMYVISSM